jgi:probable phosphoglycerate mutase
MPRLLLIRHASTDALGKMLCGRAPGFHLNAAGQEQVRLLGRRMSQISDLRAVYSSPLERAQETAQTVAAAHQLTVQTDERFNEVAYGEWTGLTFDQIKNDSRWDAYNRFRSLGSAPGGEGILAVQERAWRGIAAILERHTEGTIAIVSHADVIRALLVFFLAMPIDCILRLEITPASVTALSVGFGTQPILHQMNGTGDVI